MKFTYKNDLSELSKLTADIQMFCTKFHIPQEALYALNLCLDEVLTNVISYGLNYKPKDYVIEIELFTANNRINAIVRDSGIPFNPIKNTSPADTTSNIDNRKIGGLGVYFLEEYMDDVQYQRENNLNILTLTKKIPSPPPFFLPPPRKT